MGQDGRADGYQSQSVKRISACAGLLAFALACSSQKDAPTTDTLRTATPVPLPASPVSQTPSASDCPHDGKWALCSVERRLKQSGFVVKSVADSTSRAGFSVKPAVYTLGKSRLEVFLYRDSASAARDIAKLDTLTVGPVGKPSQWGEDQPTLIRSANMAAVLLSGSARQIERAMNALTAGPPQPGSPR